ncbi:unnamed protein product [Colias eurytheme]|nr:unnamed protein product [Colias eurytheme]
MLDLFIDKCNKVREINGNICILGDFNLGAIDWSLLGSNDAVFPKICQTLIDFINTNGFKQHNHIVNKFNRTLDLVISDLPFCSVYQAHNTLSVLDAHHPALDIDISLAVEQKLPYNKSNVKFNFYKADYTMICQELSQYNWNIFNEYDDVNLMLDMFYEKIFAVIHKYVPRINTKKNRYPPWFSNKLIRLLKEKLNKRRRYKKYKNPRDAFELEVYTCGYRML